MKVLIICNYYQPQLGYAESQVATELQKLGHEVRVLTGNKYFPFPQYDATVRHLLGDRFLKSGMHIEQAVLVERRPIILELFSRAVFGGIFSTVLTFQPDTVLVFGVTTPSAIQAAVAKVLLDRTMRLVLIDSHLPSELESGSQLLKSFFYATLRLTAAPFLSKQADKIIAVQEDTKTVIRDVYGINFPIDLVSHGTDLKLFKFDPQHRAKIRKALGITPKDFVIVYTGKLIPQKGIDVLIKAWLKLQKMNYPSYLLLVGGGPEDYVSQLLSSIPEEHAHKIKVIGPQKRTQLPGYYSAAEVAVWPLQESLSMLDAAACSLPFIANHTLGARERVSNDNALLYRKGSPRDLAKKIAYLYDNTAQRKAMGKRGRALVEKNFSWRTVSEKYL